MYPIPGKDGDGGYAEENDHHGRKEMGDGSYRRRHFVNVKSIVVCLSRPGKIVAKPSVDLPGLGCSITILFLFMFPNT